MEKTEIVMDYEKKDFRKLYEDLVKSEWFKKAYHDKSLGDCPFNIPELAESEDERIRKWLIHEIEAIYVTDGIVKNENADKALAWLEKQKESLHISETCKEKADSFTDEDERIRKAIIHYILYETKGNISEATEYVWVTWLEKQKEQKPLSTEETELNSLAFLSQMGYTCIPPKKEHQSNTDAPKNALGGALNSPLDKDKNLDDIAQDYVEAVKEYNPELTWNLMQTAVCYGYHYREGEEQKPVEWSDTNELVFNDICKHLENEGYSGWVVLLNALRNGEFQFKQEWSEGDEKMLAAISKALGCDTAEKTLVNEGVTLVMAASFLESLRPSWKPSEVCYGAKGDPDPAGVWKPSEEQMRCLDMVLCDEAMDDNVHRVLVQLREQLKRQV